MELLDFAKTDTAARLRAAAKRGALSHALIFSGSGDRVSAARYAAAAMECTAESKPCLACPACRKVMQDIHPDVTFVRDAEHKELSIDTVRAMRADAFIRPNEGARKVYIFEDCTILTEKDQNVLLKLVEEGRSRPEKRDGGHNDRHHVHRAQRARYRESNCHCRLREKRNRPRRNTQMIQHGKTGRCPVLLRFLSLTRR